MFNRFKDKIYRDKLLNLRDNYYQSSYILDNDISALLERLKEIGIKNAEYNSIYLNFNEQFYSILNGLDKDCTISFANFEDLLNNANYHGIKNIYESINQTLIAYQQSINNLKNNLDSFFNVQDELRESINETKEEYRRLKSYISSQEDNFIYIKEELNNFINSLDIDINEFYSLVDNYDIEKARIQLEEIEQIVRTTNKYFFDLVDLVSTSFVGLVQMSQTISEFYTTKIKQNKLIKLNDFDELILKINNLTSQCQNLIKSFKFDSAILLTSKLFETLRKLEAFLIKQYDDYKELIYLKESNKLDSAYYISKIDNLIDNLNIYKDVYVIPNKIKNTITHSLIHNAKISLIDEEINLYLELNNVYASTILHLNQKKKQLIESLNSDIFKLEYFLSKIKFDAEEAYEEFHQTYLKYLSFLGLINDVNHIHFEKIHQNIAPYVNDELKLIENILVLTPIDLEKAKRHLTTLSNYLNNKYDEVNKEITLMSKAENSLVYANRIRFDNIEFFKILDESERLFFEGNFQKSLELSLSCLRKVYK